MIYAKIKTRVKFVFIVFICFFIAIISKLFYLQLYQYGYLTNKATSLWQRSFPIEGDRGRIYDIDGNILATNLTTSSLIVVPNQVLDKEVCANKLSALLNIEQNEVYNKISKNV